MGWIKSVIVSGDTAQGTAKYYKEGSFDSSELPTIKKDDLVDGSVVFTSDNGNCYCYNEKQDDFIFQLSLQG